ncbi:MAG: hypothetical protein JNK17_02190 [Hydrogenophaga sp.]|nr:hypothetical protein [Hydrogenophaga sp.]
MMKRLFVWAALAASVALAGCSALTDGSGFKVATDANTARGDTYQENILLQAGHDLEAVNACYLRASGYARVSGTKNAVFKIGEPTSAEGCTVMATALRTQSNMLTAFAPFIAQALMGRVPAAPEEIIESLLKDGMKFALMKFGVSAVTKVVESGQLAQAQIAQAAINKPTQVIEQPVLVTVPEGAAVLPTQ